MTASQSSFSLSNRSFSFAGALGHAFALDEDDVVWADPDVSWTQNDVSQYDIVLAGIAPVLSVTANKAYGILALVDSLYESKKLRLFVDAPEPTKIHASLRSVARDSSRITKELYAKRKNYNDVVMNKKLQQKVLSGASILLSERWPTTIYPALPTGQSVSDSPGIPQSMSSAFRGVNVDSLFIENKMPINSRRENYWVADNQKTRWFSDTFNHLMYPAKDARQRRTWTDADVVESVSSALGVIVGPHDDKLLWWSPRFIQAMNTLTPIATEWRLAAPIGPDWTHLAAGIEEMSIVDRYEVAAAQREQYVASIPSRQNATTKLKEGIEI